MVAANWRERIVVDPAVHHGAPLIRGTRISVSAIVGSVADGDTADDLLHAYPQLAPEDIAAALRYCSRGCQPG